jgi:DNA-directed RNA polymerase specialized sigma24 family protein
MERYDVIEFQRIDGGAKQQSTVQKAKERVFDLYWLALLITGNSATAADLVVGLVESQAGGDSFFSAWMLAWARRIVIAKALAAIREDLSASARRTSVAGPERPASLRTADCAMTKHDLERAVLGIDTFPRCALVLSFFEKVPMQDAVILLDANSSLIRKAEFIGLRQLNRNLAGGGNSQTTVTTARVARVEVQNVRA